MRLISAFALASMPGLFVSAAVGSATTSHPPALLTFKLVDERLQGNEAAGTLGGGYCLSRSPGKRQLRLTDPSIRSRGLAWSPDGRRFVVAITGDTGDRLHVGSVGRRRLVRVGQESTYLLDPAWSPDEKLIAYTVAFSAGGGELWVVRPDGRGERMVTRTASSPRRPSWSPDSKHLLYTTAATPYTSVPTIREIDLDGGSDHLVIANAADAVFSPDGSKIAYTGFPHGTSNADTDVMIANSDASSPRAVGATPEPEGLAAWSPDGSRIAFVRGPEWHTRIVVVSANGGQDHVAVAGPLPVTDPAWRAPVSLPRTMKQPCMIRGTARRNVIVGTRLGDLILGGGGNDLIRGNGGNDVIDGGPGADVIYGGAGNDFLDGGLGRDRLYGGPGNDQLFVRDGQPDLANGGAGLDSVDADEFDELVSIER